MSRRGLVALAIVAAAMAGYLVFGGRGRQDRERGDARARLLPPFDCQAVHRIVIRQHGGEPFSLLHAPSPAAPGSTWRIETAKAPPGDDAAIADLVSAMDLAESDRTANISPEVAGLRPPAVEVDMETASGVLSAQLGRPDAAGKGVYARAGTQGPIRVVSRRLLELAAREPAAFRDRRVFPVDSAAVTSIVWRDKAGVHELRAVDGRWQNARKEWVEDGRLTEALRRLLALRIDEFGYDELVGDRMLTLTAGASTIRVEGGDGGTLERDLENLRVPADALALAWRALAAAEVRDERLLALAPDTVTRVDLRDEHARVGLRRVGGAWTFSTPKVAYAADTKVVDDWLARLGTIRTATRAGGPNARHLIVEGRFRQQVDVASPPSVHALLAPDPLRFRERAVLSFARFDVRRLQRTAGKTTQQVTTDDGGAAQVIGALSDLRAEEFIASPPAGEPAVRLEIDLQPPGERQLVHHAVQIFGAKEGCVARLDADATFTLARAACDALRMPLLPKPD